MGIFVKAPTIQILHSQIPPITEMYVLPIPQIVARVYQPPSIPSPIIVNMWKQTQRKSLLTIMHFTYLSYMYDLLVYISSQVQEK